MILYGLMLKKHEGETATKSTQQVIKLIAYNHNQQLVATNEEPVMDASPAEDIEQKQTSTCGLVEDYDQ